MALCTLRSSTRRPHLRQVGGLASSTIGKYSTKNSEWGIGHCELFIITFCQVSTDAGEVIVHDWTYDKNMLSSRCMVQGGKQIPHLLNTV